MELIVKQIVVHLLKACNATVKNNEVACKCEKQASNNWNEKKRCRAIFKVCTHFWKDCKYIKLEKGR